MSQFSVQQEDFGALPNGARVQKITLRQESPDLHAKYSTVVTNFGGRLLAFTGPDRHGEAANIIRGPSTLAECLGDTNYAGAIIGRYANRIASASFILDGTRYLLSANSAGNTLHGGNCGFDGALWQIVTAEHHVDHAYVEMTHTSPHGDQGFPGNLQVRARYTLFAGGRLQLHLSATTDQVTVISLTAHPYFNLLGVLNQRTDVGDEPSGGQCLQHQLQIPAAAFLAISPQGIPAGAPRSVAHTPFDFREPSVLQDRLGIADQQLLSGCGFDHCYLIDNAWPSSAQPTLHATLYEPQSGRQLRVHSTLPGLQFYSGNFLGRGGDSSQWNGARPTCREALCLEPQFPPDAPNRPDFPSTRLAPGDEWRHVIVYSLGVVP